MRRGNRVPGLIVAALVLGGLALAGLALPAPAQEAGAPAWYAWSPKPDILPPYKAPNRPVWRLAALLAAHRGQKSWSQEIIRTDRYSAKWIQMAPGERTPALFYGDDRVFWVVWGGQIRFTIAGQKPFIASKGFLVQVPQRVAYSMETVGERPSLRFELTHAGILPVYPADNGEAKPADPHDRLGTRYIKVSYPTPPDPYDEVNWPYVDFFKDVVAAHPTEAPKHHLVMADEANMANIIRGPGVPTPSPGNRGHFHLENEEFWFILEGKCDYLIEGVGLFTADAGDVVLVPPGRFHRASWAAGQMDTRLSFNIQPYLFHNFAADAGGKQ